MAIGERKVIRVGKDFSHTAIILHPDNPSDFKNDSSTKWYKTKSGELEATLSANPNHKPNFNSPFFGNLTAYPSDPSDRPDKLKTSQRIIDPQKRSDTQLIKDIINSANKYKNDLPYDPTPFPPYYNSNSYTRGVLKDAKINNPPNLTGIKPGWNYPIPLRKDE